MTKKPIVQYEYKDNKERLAMLKKTARQINKEHGIQTLHFGDEHKQVEKLAFLFKPIDKLFGGGLAHGNFTTIWGGSGSGKSTLAHMLTASAQLEGKLVYYIALEPYDKSRAKQFGVNLDNLMIGEFPQAEQSLDTIVEFARKKLVDVIILDSIHSLAPKGMQEDKKGNKSLATDTMALLARKLSEFFKVAVDPVKRANIAVLLIGQTRTANLGTMYPIQKLSGGAALVHYSKAIVHMMRGQKANAPSEKIDTGKLTPSGNKSYETKAIGFESVLKVDMCQIDGMKNEGTELRLPYHFSSGFYLPEYLQKEIAEEEKEITEQENRLTLDKNINKDLIKKKRGRPRNNEKK